MRPAVFAAFPFPLAAALAGVAVICGCRHPMADYENSLIAGNYASAASIATEEAKDGDNDELMWRLMAGSARRLAGETETAIAQFDKAEDVMIEHDGASVFSKGVATAWAMVTNDKAFPYDGGGQDRIMTCFYKAVDFAATGKPEAARTEFNRAAQHQENWLSERRKEIADAKERLVVRHHRPGRRHALREDRRPVMLDHHVFGLVELRDGGLGLARETPGAPGHQPPHQFVVVAVLGLFRGD